MPDAPTCDEPRAARRRPRWRTAVPAALGLSVLTGFGAAATSAAWTDDAYFSTAASAAEIDLRGSSDGATWSPADTAGTAVTLAPVTGLTPDRPVERTVHLWNASTVPLTLAWGTANPTTLLQGCVTVTYSSLPTAALAGSPSSPSGAAVTTATVTFTVPAGADAATCSGQSLGAIDVVVQGRTS
ncbi:hypothetical protein [Cellulomonas persica]|uniref:Ribosomally synthesized peptide with SipW-like signal peptide n=1 Tax=Cellulomonas persica TaxID=76861 RepID=A0A510UV59_9CELL|nr:hypothetical protein [Cellulomonas persica]GEK18548.1 hypothetical protein CPE01_22810 [Cellulomonas persica]